MTASVLASEAWENGPPPGRFENEPPSASGPSLVVPTIAVLDGPALAKPLPEVEYLVREIGLVAGSGAPHLVAGYGFAGKTIALQALLLALAAGRSVWEGFRVAQRRRVLHVDLEQGQRLTARRYQRLAAGAGIDLAGLGDALAVATMPPLSLADEHRDAWRRLMAGRDLVVIDSLRAATRGADENDSSIRAGLDMLGAVSEATGCRALPIHHARKPGMGDDDPRYAIRGSSAIYDACDSVYVFTAAKGEPVLVSQTKARTHGEPCEDVALVISDVEIDGDPRGGLRVAVHGAEVVTERRVARERAAEAVKARRDAEVLREAVAKSPGIGSVALREATGLSGARYRAALAALGSEIEVREVTQGRTRSTTHHLRGAS